MDWREFFRLTKEKFILFLIVLVLFRITIPLIMGQINFSGSFLDTVSNPFSVVFGYLIMPVIDPSPLYTFAITWNVLIRSVGKFIDFLYLYFISSLVLFLFNKTFRK